MLPVHRGEIQCRGLGMDVRIYDAHGHSVRGQKGELVCASPFPSMPIGFWNDASGAAYRRAYFERYFDVLAVAQVESAATQTLHLKAGDGAALTLKPLPYALPE